MFEAVSRYDHPSAAAALGTPVLATALHILALAWRLSYKLGRDIQPPAIAGGSDSFQRDVRDQPACALASS